MTDTPPNLRKRLWQFGGAVALFLAALALAGALFDPSSRDGKLWLGHDFLPAYVAGRFVRAGEPGKMYDRAAFLAAQDQVVREADLEMTGRYAAALNPPHFALPFAPLSALPYRAAAAVWLGLNVAFFAASTVLLVRLLPPDCWRDWKTWGLVPLLAMTSMPFLQTAGHQQNTFLSLLILSATATLWRQRRAFLSGAILGLLFYKPQLALVIALILVADLGRRAVLGLGVTGVALLLLTILVMPGALAAYIHNLPGNLAWIQSQPGYNWGRQVTLFGFARFLGAPAGVAHAAWIVAAIGLVGGTILTCLVRPRIGTDRLITLAIIATPLLIPYCLDYDLLLQAVPAVLFAGGVISASTPWRRADRLALWAWVALYAWLYANPALSGVIGVSLTAPLLATLAATRIAGARTSGGENREPAPQPAPTPRGAEARGALAA